MKTTGNYGLKKPDGTDVVNIDDLNTNADTIDAELKKRALATDVQNLSTQMADIASEIVTEPQANKILKLNSNGQFPSDVIEKEQQTDETVIKDNTVVIKTDTRSTSLIYIDSNLTQVLEKDGTSTVKTTNLTYSNGQLTKVVEIAGGTTVTTALNYDTNGNLIGTTKAVS